MTRDVPEKYRGIYEKAMKGKSRGAGVKAACLECCGYVRAEVGLCTDRECPLYPYRPYRSSAQLAKARAAVAAGSEATE